DTFTRGRAGQPAVDRQSLVHVRHVVFSDSEIEPEVDGCPPLVFEILALELANRLLEQLRVHVEADGLDVSALLATEQVAGAADLEIERGDAEAATEVAELADRGQTPAR